MCASSPQSGSEGRSKQTADCPLCSLRADSQTDIYTHLLVSHRKSAISRALLDAHRAE